MENNSVNSLSSVGESTFDGDIQSTTPSRTYPSIKDYYNASSSEPNKPIQLQPGLSNYSCLVLGDDRISYSESITNVTYKGAVEDKMAIPSPSKAKSVSVRHKDYHEALQRVGNIEVDRLEKVMKDKLVQRSAKTSSHFQVNKAFKFFDREQKSRIHIEGFTRALEFLGFQFSDIQNLALFGRYDTECVGEIDYVNFIANAMFDEVHRTGDQAGATTRSPAKTATILESKDEDDYDSQQVLPFISSLH